MTDSNAPIVFGAEEHVGLLGQTRSGKTTFANKMIVPAYGRIIVIDSKAPMRPDGKTDFPHIPECTVDDALKAASKPTGYFRWRIKWPTGRAGADKMSEFCYRWLEKAQRTALYFDEVADLMPWGVATEGLTELIRKGGGLNLVTIWGAQRTQLVSKTFYVNTHHLFSFYLERYDAHAIHEFFPEVEERMNEIPYKSYRCLYRGMGGDVRLLGAVSP